MAIKLGALKLFGGGPSRTESRPAPKPAATASGGGFLSRPLPIIGRLSAGRQLQIFTTLLVIFLVVDAAVVAIDTRESTFGTVYIATVGKIRMLSQRLAKAAQQASLGNLEAFKQLRDSRQEFAKEMNLLLAGGTSTGVTVPATSAAVRPVLEALDKDWKK